MSPSAAIWVYAYTEAEKEVFLSFTLLTALWFAHREEGEKKDSLRVTS